jgi:hypothetical protein
MELKDSRLVIKDGEVDTLNPEENWSREEKRHSIRILGNIRKFIFNNIK